MTKERMLHRKSREGNGTTRLRCAQYEEKLPRHDNRNRGTQIYKVREERHSLKDEERECNAVKWQKMGRK